MGNSLPKPPIAADGALSCFLLALSFFFQARKSQSRKASHGQSLVALFVCSICDAKAPMMRRKPVPKAF